MGGAEAPVDLPLMPLRIHHHVGQFAFAAHHVKAGLHRFGVELAAGGVLLELA